MHISVIILLIVSLFHKEGNTQQLYNHNSPNSYRNQSWMSLVDDGFPIREMNILGTHQSMTWTDPCLWDIFRSQVQTLTNQLLSGIRAVDIRVKHKNDRFQMWDRICDVGSNFDNVLTTIQTFLNSYPSETVILHLMQETESSGCSRNFDQTFVYYRNNYPGLFWTPSTQTPFLGQVRKQIVLLQDFSATSIYGLMYASFSVLPHKVYGTNWDQYDKWLDVKNFLASANTAGNSRISFWTGNTGSFPYFVASGKSSSGNGAGRLATGLTTPGFKSYYPDFPRVACFIGICTIAFQGINILAYNRIVSQGYTYLGIVYTDFFGDDLLIKFISSNNGGKYSKCTATQVSQGCNLCSSTGTCLSCNTLLNYALDSVNQICIAAPGYYLNSSYYPVACNITMPGCLQCTTDVTCTQCDTYNHYALQNGTCIAAPGYYLDANSTPIVCPQIGCQQCTDAIICVTCSNSLNYMMNPATGYTCMCDNTAHFIQAPMVDICICQASYYMTINNTCDHMPLCPDPNSGCITCASPPVCTLCDTANNFVLNNTYCICDLGYFFNGSTCIACTDTLDACTSCVSSSLCLTCLSNFTDVKGNCQCMTQYYRFDFNTCLPCLPGCLDCTSTTNCLLCDTDSNFTLITGVCECLPGMFLNMSSETCQLCSSMAGCLTCNMGGCTGCNPIFGFSLNVTICECDYGFFINSNDICEQCMMQGCIDCTSQSFCITCNTTYYFLNSLNVCDDICGDGVLIYAQCDDGNLLNGDGCSSTCTVQKDYTCVGGSMDTPSACSYSGPIILKITSAIKNPKLNQVYVEVSIIPNIASMAQLNFSSVIVPNFPCIETIITFDQTTGKIYFQFDYDTSLNDKNLQVDFIPPALPEFFYMQKAHVSLPATTDNNLALKFYDQSTYALIDLQNLAAQIIVYLYWGTTLIGLFFVSKLIVVEMMLVIQVAFCGLIMIQKLQSLFLPFVQLAPSNGYNGFIRDDSVLPPRLSVLQYNGDFLSNFNGSLLLLLLPFIIGLALYVLGCAKGDKQWKKKSYKAFKQWGITLFLLMQFQLFISFGIQFLYTKNGMGMGIGAVLIVGFSAVMGLFYFKPLNFGQYKQFFQQTFWSINFYLIVFIERTLLSSSMIFISDINMCGFVALGISTIYLILLIIIRPYLKNIRPILNSIFIVLIVAAQAVYRMNMNMAQSPFITTYLPLFILSLLIIVLIYNIIFMVLHVLETKKMLTKSPQDEEKEKILQQEMQEELRSHERKLLQIQRSLQPLKTVRTPSQRQKLQIVGLQTNRQILKNLKKQCFQPQQQQMYISYELSNLDSQSQQSISKSNSNDSI